MQTVISRSRRAITPSLAALTVMVIALLSTATHAASPHLTDVQPVGVQRGQSTSVTLHGQRLGDAAEILFYQQGIAVTELKAEDDKRVTALLDVAPDCPLGEHLLRLRTASGITELRSVWVGALPTVQEKEPNSAFDQPQQVDMNTTVMGVIKKEDVDYFAVHAKAGQRISAEVEAMRLGRAWFDPYVAILDADRFELAASDDTALLQQDAHASVIAPADGVYLIELRESSYGGNNNFHYRLHVGTFPRPTVAYPPGAKAGEPAELTLLGDPVGDMPMSLTLPMDGPAMARVDAQDESGVSPSPVYLRVNEMPVVVESGENQSRKTATVSPGPLPVAFHGVIDQPGQVDYFHFDAAKDQTVEVRVFARQLGSPVDTVVTVYHVGGKGLSSNDDKGGPDSVHRFKAPADGTYELRVRDMLGAAGPTFVYRAEVAVVLPAVSVTSAQMDSRQPQERQTVPVPAGNRYAMLMRVGREDVSGDVTLSAPALPAGVTMHADTVAGSITDVPVVFEATADAAQAGGLYDIQPRIAREQGDVVGRFVQTIPLVMGPPNQTVYYERQVEKLAVAVTQPAGFSVELVPPAVELVQNGMMDLQVRVTRDEGFDGPVTLRMLWNPPGVGAASSVKVEKGQTEAAYPINAAANAEPRTSKICIVAQADTGQGPVWVSTQLVDLTVAEPYVKGAIQMAATEQGKPAQVLCKLEQLRAFEGEAVVRLLGLPPKTETAEQTITSASEQVVFEVSTAADTPARQHKGLLCEVVVMQAGQPIVHRIAQGGVLRVDKPRPAPKPEAEAAKPAAQAKKPQAKPAAPKPLSRLEQLRQQATASDASEAEEAKQ